MDSKSPLQVDDALRWRLLEVAAQRVVESGRRLAVQTSGFFDSVRQVVLVSSSSRSGSSMLAQLLCNSSKFLHFPGEINPFLRMAGLAWPDSGSSDGLSPEMCTGAAIKVLQDYFALEIGSPAACEHQEVGEEFAESLYRRLCLQWPLEEFTLEDVQAAMTTALTGVESLRGHACDWTTDLQLFHLLFLKQIRIGKPAINPYYYDLDRALVQKVFPELRIPTGAPSPVLIEEPPFILIRPWTRWQPSDLLERVVVIKTPSNAYRLGFFQALFPSANFRLLHLTRNPAASINGIYDGWSHWGFHSHYVGPELEVPGYSEPDSADQGWWKFDLPPGWRAHLRSPLDQICAFQWSSAQSAILDYASRADVDYMRVRFEDILNGPENRLKVYQDLCAWLEIADDKLLEALSRPLSPIMATKTPRLRRWHDNADVLRRVIAQPTIRSLAETLGYTEESEWI